MILVIDNYDSFTYNLVHYLNELGAATLVRRNDALTVQEALGLKPEAVLLSPGPCAPDQAGICLPLLRGAPDDLPILGPSAVVPGLIYATAHYRNGVMLTPLTVQLVDDLVFDKGSDPALRDLDPARHGRL